MFQSLIDLPAVSNRSPSTLQLTLVAPCLSTFHLRGRNEGEEEEEGEKEEERVHFMEVMYTVTIYLVDSAEDGFHTIIRDEPSAANILSLPHARLTTLLLLDSDYMRKEKS